MGSETSREQVILPLGTKVRSLREPLITGTVQGYGTLSIPETSYLRISEHPNPIFIYLVWPENMLGSSSLPGMYVHVLDSGQVEVI